MSVPKQFVFAATVEGEPWWVIGEVTARILAPLGYQVQLEPRALMSENPRWVGRGDALIGVCMPRMVLWAQQGKHGYKGESYPEFRAIANITRPQWLAVAATVESRIGSLAQIKEQCIPVRVLTVSLDNVSGVLPRRILSHYGLSPEEIVNWGGKFHTMDVPYGSCIRENDVDLIISPVYMGYTPVARYWQEASILLNLRFLSLPDELIDELCREGNGRRANMPHGLLRGLDRDIATYSQPELMVYGRSDLPEDFAYELARAYDENSSAFLETRIHIAYNPRNVWQTLVPLHPGAERYYRERGYMH